MRVQVEVDHSALDHAVTCREQAEFIRTSLSELRSVAQVLGLSDSDGQPSEITNGKLAVFLEKLIDVQADALVALDELASTCDELVAKRMQEFWEDLPHPAVMWATDMTHTVLLGVGFISLALLGYVKVHKWRSDTAGPVIEQIRYSAPGGFNGPR